MLLSNKIVVAGESLPFFVDNLYLYVWVLYLKLWKLLNMFRTLSLKFFEIR